MQLLFCHSFKIFTTSNQICLFLKFSSSKVSDHGRMFNLERNLIYTVVVLHQVGFWIFPLCFHKIGVRCPSLQLSRLTCGVFASKVHWQKNPCHRAVSSSFLSISVQSATYNMSRIDQALFNQIITIVVSVCSWGKIVVVTIRIMHFIIVF